MCGHTGRGACGASEDNIGELAVCFYCVVLRIELRMSGLAVNTFTNCAILLAPK